MSTSNDIQRTLRECRMLLSVLRTPKLRERLAAVLQARSDEERAAAMQGPLSRLSWLDARDGFSVDGLGQAMDTLGDLMGESGILGMRRIAAMPQNEPERVALLRRIYARVFDNTGPRRWLTEPELNARLAMLVDNVAETRRYGIDYGIVERADDGARYWLATA